MGFSAIKGNGKSSTTRGLRVLLVDNELETICILEILLELFGHTVCVVSGDTDFIQEIQAFKPAVILMDIGLPRITDHVVAKTIRALPQFDRVAIVALSSSLGPKMKQQLMKSGCDAHLVTPVPLTVLDAVIHKQVKERLLRSSAPLS